MKKIIFFLIVICVSLGSTAQKHAYRETMAKFQQAYVDSHEVVKGPDRKFLHFFAINEKYKVTASFTRLNDTSVFVMKTSGKVSKKFYRYGTLSFKLNDSLLHLTVYQSLQLIKDPKYKDDLFIPYTDLTTGEESYGGGRYIDILTTDIKNNMVVIDFNKAYNPYCSYTTGYNCPIPPRENDLPIAVKAGEMKFGKAH